MQAWVASTGIYIYISSASSEGERLAPVIRRPGEVDVVYLMCNAPLPRLVVIVVYLNRRTARRVIVMIIDMQKILHIVDGKHAKIID